MKWQHAIKDYQLFLKIERGLSQNSIDSYTRDIHKLLRYLEENNINISPIAIDIEVIQGFIYEVAKAGGIGVAFNYNQTLKGFLDEKIAEDYSLKDRIHFIEPKGPNSNLRRVLEII